MDKEELWFAILGIRRARDLNHLREEDGFYVLFFVEHVDTREDSSVLKSCEALLMSGGNVHRGRHSGGGGGCTEVRDVLGGRAVARSSYGG